MTTHALRGRTRYPGKVDERIVLKWWLAGGINPANCIAAYQPKGASSYLRSKENLVNPGTYDAEGTAPSWTAANGWDFVSSATSTHLWTGITPENDQTWSMIARFDDATETASATLAGFVNQAGSAAFMFLTPARGPADEMIWANGGDVKAHPRESSGVMAVAGNNGYYNKTKYVNGTIPAYDAAAIEVVIGGFNVRTGAGRTLNAVTFDGRVQAFAIYDIDISDYVSGLTDAMNAL